MMHSADIGGQRAGAFLELVGGVDPRRVLVVGVDVAKATWLWWPGTWLGRSWSTACGWSPTGLAWPSCSA
jgi:hypothetical protein